jgi:hypothetical protein
MKIHLRNFCLGLCAGVFVLLASLAPARAFIAVNIGIAPPPLPISVYEQPSCPGDGYIWTPGYWAWDPSEDQYYWVPGQWALAPEVGYLWTPAWWGWADGGYCFHPGYWGRNVGFYGGIAYGHGYNGRGYDGGYWSGRHFRYNRNANNVGAVASADVYSRAVATNHDRVSFNGGRGGVSSRPTTADRRDNRESHFSATTAAARTSPSSFRAANEFGVTHHASNVSSAFRPTTHSGFASNARFTGENVESRHVATERHHATTEARSFRMENHASVSRPHFSESRAPSFHTQSFHAQSFHASASHGSAVHASASHGGGGHGSHR